ncbi:hypothetical protein BY996DRAFT_4579176 [Phakopsora pachyrhizi]|uniref:ATP-dependent DNA helicase CHL1 n=1 Tax=Phakopsora pachyrhizi TaxID=170000 RepID=A0AAV0AHE3_PHAPC|nr:hypothetical protein BY996DRAFT_4579176 [Phakopsora pachyrhizi]CAH7667177.1 hypothetical protein PPACK8108_LOCUS1568 [Phakopsora pachyrhizi]
MIENFEQTVPDDFRFPFEPYHTQTDFMRKLFEVIEQGKVGIFESPTGTGKSLSIICSTLSWLESNHNRITEETIRNLISNLRRELPDEPEWVILHEVDRKKRELLEDEEILEKRLEMIRKQEVTSKRRFEQQFPESGHPSKKRKTLSTQELSDDEFAPDDEPNEEEEVGPDGLPRGVQRILDQHNESKARRNQEAEAEPDCRKVYFTSRTHSQLSQFTGELRKTSFSDTIRTIPLGSRLNLCINRDVKNKAKSLEAINETCLELQKAGKNCPHLPPMEDQDRMIQFRDHALAKIHDIEELAELGRSKNCCPYYASRKAVRQAQVVTLPYNLLLQPSARNSLGIKLEDNIVVIDEAHNLIDNILAIHSVSLSNLQIDNTKRVFAVYIKRFAKKLKGSNLVHLKHLVRIFDCLLKFCSSWSDGTSGKNQRQEEIFTISNVLEKSRVLDQLNVLELQKYLRESKIINKVAGYSSKLEQDKNSESFDKAHQTRSNFITVFYKIQSFISALSNNDKDGRVLITREMTNDQQNPILRIKYQLLNPSSSFQDIVTQSRSVILAGGTMAPMKDFHDQLFNFVEPQRIVDFSCSHIVPDENLLVRAVTKGPGGTRLELKFSSKTDTKLLDELGQSLVNVCNVVNHGVVCFLPSYKMLEIMTERWKQTGLWDRLRGKKQISVEPTSSADVERTLSSYASVIGSPPKPLTGALMLAVVGGKLSEGINFSNDLCRAVIVMGVPFPNSQSPEVRERVKYVESLNGGKKEAGIEFYANLAFKAVVECFLFFFFFF